MWIVSPDASDESERGFPKPRGHARGKSHKVPMDRDKRGFGAVRPPKAKPRSDSSLVSGKAIQIRAETAPVLGAKRILVKWRAGVANRFAAFFHVSAIRFSRHPEGSIHLKNCG